MSESNPPADIAGMAPVISETPQALPAWLSREEIDAIIDGMSAADLLEALGDGTTVKGAKMLGTAFDAAAARAGFSNGTSATEHVRIRDFKYLADELGKVVSVENPTSDSTPD